ncbi:hypothetical protein SGPA1_70005 [Streptomyces misionensis JCM 4497]
MPRPSDRGAAPLSCAGGECQIRTHCSPERETRRSGAGGRKLWAIPFPRCMKFHTVYVSKFIHLGGSVRVSHPGHRRPRHRRHAARLDRLRAVPGAGRRTVRPRQSRRDDPAGPPGGRHRAGLRRQRPPPDDVDARRRDPQGH